MSATYGKHTISFIRERIVWIPAFVSSVVTESMMTLISLLWSKESRNNYRGPLARWSRTFCRISWIIPRWWHVASPPSLSSFLIDTPSTSNLCSADLRRRRQRRKHDTAHTHTYPYTHTRTHGRAKGRVLCLIRSPRNQSMPRQLPASVLIGKHERNERASPMLSREFTSRFHREPRHRLKRSAFLRELVKSSRDKGRRSRDCRLEIFVRQ